MLSNKAPFRLTNNKNFYHIDAGIDIFSGSMIDLLHFDTNDSIDP